MIGEPFASAPIVLQAGEAQQRPLGTARHGVERGRLDVRVRRQMVADHVLEFVEAVAAHLATVAEYAQFQAVLVRFALDVLRLHVIVQVHRVGELLAAGQTLPHRRYGGVRTALDTIAHENLAGRRVLRQLDALFARRLVFLLRL